MLTREAILGAQDIKTLDVNVEEWGGVVRVRSMSGAERDAFGASMVGPDGKPNLEQYGIKLLLRCIVGEDGAPLFTADDITALGAKSAVALRRVTDAAERLNTIGEEAVKAAEKN